MAAALYLWHMKNASSHAVERGDGVYTNHKPQLEHAFEIGAAID